MKKILLLSMIFVSYLLSDIGTLAHKEGLVKIKHKNSIKKTSMKINDKIKVGDTIYTYKSIAVIELSDKSVIKLSPNSEISFNKDKFAQKSGEVYFNIKKRNTNKIIISTSFTTIGVKGTTFIVNDASDDCIVSLKTGKLNLKSKNGDYEIHKMKVLSEYQEYLNNQKEEFEEYKKTLYEEFIEYKSEFDLQENRSVSFNGNKVYEKHFDKKIDKKFEEFEDEFKLNNFIETNITKAK
jgi:hypothetical protein